MAKLNPIPLLTIVVLLCGLAGAVSANDELDYLGTLEPTPGLSPRDVVDVQMRALVANNENDQGIEIAYRFAAPINRQLTGPLDQFRKIMRTGIYRPMLNAQKVRYQKEFEGSSLAAQTVVVTDLIGVEHHFMFVLRKQFRGEFKDCWMTESVFSKPKPPPHLPTPT